MDISIIVIILLAVALLFGTLFGMMRGRNRSILRLILIIGCIAGAVCLVPMIKEIVMEIDTGKGTLGEMLTAMEGEGGGNVPQEMLDISSALMTAISLLIFILVFNVLRFVSWLIIFPICKIFVKKDLIKKKGFGAIIGLVQGLVIAFAVLVPLNGLIGELHTISSTEIEGKTMIEIPAELGLDKYEDSAISGDRKSVV